MVEEKLEEWQDRRKYKVTIRKPLPPKRHSISVTDSTVESMGLIGRLPYEIRHMIYIYALGNSVLHLTRMAAPRRIRHFDCQLSAQCDHSHPWYGFPSHSRLAFVKICRQAYREGMDVLYSTNTFGIFGAQGLASFAYFSRTITPYRLASISSVYINCTTSDLEPLRGLIYESIFKKSENRNHWKLMWGVMATKMPGLQHLRVRLTRLRDLPVELGGEEDWINPMLKVHGLESFSFSLDDRDPIVGEDRELLGALVQQLEKTLCTPRNLPSKKPYVEDDAH